MVGELDQRARREDVELGRGPGRLRPAGGGADEAEAARVGGDRRRQHAGDRADRAVERELADDGVAVERVGGDRADRRHHGERDRQIVVAALLGQVGGGEIDGDAARRQRQAGGDQRGAHPLAQFGDRLVAEADDGEGDGAVGDLDLDVDRARLDAFERHCGYARDHAAPRPAATAAVRTRNICRTETRWQEAAAAPSVTRRVL